MKTALWIKHITAALLGLLIMAQAVHIQGEEQKNEIENSLNYNTVSDEIIATYPGKPDKALNDAEKESLRRDPFSATSGIISRRVVPAMDRPKSDINFQPGTSPAGIPKMKLKGHLQSKDGETVALLEIEGSGVHIVREGDTVGLHNLGRDSVIKIRKISRLHIVIESGTLGKLIIVR